MRIIYNEDLDLVEEIQRRLRETGGYCPCALSHNKDTKCMCKEFREQVKAGIKGECNCGLYEAIEG